MILWRGLGFLVAILTFCLLAASEFISESLTQDENYYQENKSPTVIAFFVAGLLTWRLSKRLDKKAGNVFIDKETGQEVVTSSKHELFFIPVKYWGLLLIGCSFLALILK